MRLIVTYPPGKTVYVGFPDSMRIQPAKSCAEEKSPARAAQYAPRDVGVGFEISEADEHGWRTLKNKKGCSFHVKDGSGREFIDCRLSPR